MTVGAAALGLGCSTTMTDWDRTDLPYPQTLDRPRSIVYESPALRRLLTKQHSSQADRFTTPWYASRNDTQRSASVAGSLVDQRQRSRTVTVDRQVTVNGKTHQYHATTTYHQSTSRPLGP